MVEIKTACCHECPPKDCTFHFIQLELATAEAVGKVKKTKFMLIPHHIIKQHRAFV